MSELKIRFNDDGSILIKNVRGSYLHIFEKWGKETDPKEKWRYSGKFLLDKKTHAAEITALRRHLEKLQQEWFKGKLGSANIFFRNGEDSGKEEQEDSWVVSASDGRKRPRVMGRKKETITADDDIIYSGCYVNVLINPWKQDNAHGKKLNANLVAVQFVRDGERFGEGGIDADQHFEDEEGEEGGSHDDFDD